MTVLHFIGRLLFFLAENAFLLLLIPLTPSIVWFAFRTYLVAQNKFIQDWKPTIDVVLGLWAILIGVLSLMASLNWLDNLKPSPPPAQPPKSEVPKPEPTERGNASGSAVGALYYTPTDRPILLFSDPGPNSRPVAMLKQASVVARRTADASSPSAERGVSAWLKVVLIEGTYCDVLENNQPGECHRTDEVSRLSPPSGWLRSGHLETITGLHRR